MSVAVGSLAAAEARLAHGDVPAAERWCREALGLDGDNPAALALLAQILVRAGRAEDALAHAYAAVEADGRCAKGRESLGVSLGAVGRQVDAIVSLSRAIELDPDAATAHNYLGEAYAATRCTPAAEDEFRAALRINGEFAAAARNLAALLQAEGRTREAVTALQRAVELQPRDISLRRALAASFDLLQQPEDVAAVLTEALGLAPGDADIGKTLAQALLGLGRLGEALAHSEAVAARNPADADAQFTLGNVFMRLNRPADAIACYRRVIALKPDAPRAQFSLASPLLMLGQYPAGWDHYEARLDMTDIPWKVPSPRSRLWDGAPLQGRHLLVHAEQGFGDTLQFIRYLPLLRAREGPAARIDVLCEPRLERVLGTVRGIDNVLAPEFIDRPEYDVQVPLLSLPQRLGTTVDTIPSEVPYIGLPEATHTRIERSPETRLVVAINWAGRPTHADDRMRSLSLAELATLFDLDDVLFVSLQFGDRRKDLQPYLSRANVIDLAGDFAETLAVLDQVDLLISVDTSAVHLAGAFAKPVWTLLSFGGEWRWFTEREDSPWYPTMRLFRQTRAGDWAETIGRVRKALLDKLADASG